MTPNSMIFTQERIMEQSGGNLRALAVICEFHQSYF